jgi:hypothetical protein
VSPILDEAICQLGDEDRTAILLRFFEGLDFRSVGVALGSQEGAARMRVNRALEKLHVLLKRRGITLSVAALGTVLSSEAIAAAPAGLAVSVAATALASSATGVGVSSTLFKLVTMTKLQMGIIGAVLVIGTTILVVQYQDSTKQQAENQALRQELAQLQKENMGLSNRLDQARYTTTMNSDRLRELLRLRGEIGKLRRNQRELEQALAAGRQNVPVASAQQVATSSGQPAPFQVQLVAEEAGDNTESVTNSASNENLYVQKTPLLDYTAIRSANVTTDPNTGTPQIEVEFSDEGKDLFAQVTREHLNQRLAIVLNGQLYAAPVIRSEITGGKAVVTGNFTEEEARALAARIGEAITLK